MIMQIVPSTFDIYRYAAADMGGLADSPDKFPYLNRQEAQGLKPSI
jgi:hypothetical protein